MGWSSANEILIDTAEAMKKNFSYSLKEKQINVLVALIEALEDGDADCLDECYGRTKVLDKALDKAGWRNADDEDWDSVF